MTKIGPQGRLQFQPLQSTTGSTTSSARIRTKDGDLCFVTSKKTKILDRAHLLKDVRNNGVLRREVVRLIRTWT